jgi:Xaa-Pro aminopeptidase
MSHFGPDFFRANRERLTSLFSGTAPIVLTAHGLLQRNHDTTYPFRQDSNFWYLTGIEEPDIVLVIDKEKEYLIAPVREGVRETFDGTIDVNALRAVSGVNEVLSYKEGWKRLGARLKRVGHVATFAAPQGYVEPLGLFTNPARTRLIETMKQHNSNLELLDLRPHITKMRTIKQPQELAAIQEAIDITISGFKELKKKGLASFKTEFAIEAALTAGFRQHQATHAYQPIIATGANACTLHYIQNNDNLRPNELVLLDVGAEVSNYAADLTRTYSLEQPTKRQLQVHAAVLSGHEYALSLLKPGTIIRKYEKQMEQFMGEKLRELGLIKTISTEAVRTFYPHATSHFLGLDVHDVGDYEAPLEEGMVLTIEPGIYIPAESIGIRLEDNVVVTKTGVRLLSDHLPLDLT